MCRKFYRLEQTFPFLIITNPLGNDSVGSVIPLIVAELSLR